MNFLQNRVTVFFCIMIACVILASGCRTDSQSAAQKRLDRSLKERAEAREQSAEDYESAVELIGENEYAPALVKLQEAIASDPNNIYAWSTMSQVRFEIGDIRGSLAAATEAVRLAPRLAEAHYNHGLILQAAGRYAGAIDAYEMALSINPDLLEAMENLARCYILVNDKLPRAQELVERALLSETRADWRIWLERVRLNLTEQQEALEQ